MSSAAENIVELIFKCSKCEQSKPASEFNKDKYRKNRGYSWRCKDCKTSTRKYYEVSSDTSEQISNGVRSCVECKKEKKLSNFRKDRSCKLGRNYRCKSCAQEKAKIYRSTKEYKEKNRNPQRDLNYKKTYGITLEEVRNILSSQMGLCANRACGKEIFIDTLEMKNKGYLDHCHSTGKVRGMLCIGCNTALGHIENKNRMLGLTEYLQKHSN